MNSKPTVKAVFVQVLEYPARKVILKRGKNAADYSEYTEEAGCTVWDTLCSVKEALYEPVGMWLPDKYRRPGTSVYLLGVEVPYDFNGTIPEGFEIMDLPACTMMIFQGQPFDDSDHERQVQELWDSIKAFEPGLYGFAWDDSAPRIQLEPQGYRGCIEGCAVKKVNTQNWWRSKEYKEVKSND